MDYLLGSLYVTRCYEALDTANDAANNNNNPNSLNQSAQEVSLGAGGGLVENLSTPLDQSDLTDSPADLFTARRSTAKPSMADRVDTAFLSKEADHRDGDSEGVPQGHVRSSVPATVTAASNVTNSSIGRPPSVNQSSALSGHVTPVATAACPSDLLSPRSPESSPGRASLPPFQNPTPVEYAVPVCELENKYVLLYLAPPTEAYHHGDSSNVTYYCPTAHTLANGSHPYADSTGAGSDTSGYDGFQPPGTRRPRQEAHTNPISAVALWKTQQQQQQQHSHSPRPVAGAAGLSMTTRSVGLREQSSPPRPTNSAVAAAGSTPSPVSRSRTRAPRSGPLALPTDKLLLLFYGLLMEQLLEAETAKKAGGESVGDDRGASTIPNPRRSMWPEAGAQSSSMRVATGGVAANVGAPVAVLEVQYVPLTGISTDDGGLAVTDDTHLGGPSGRAAAHASQGGNALPSSSVANTASATRAALSLSVPKSLGLSLSPNGQGSPLIGPSRQSSAYRPASPLPASLSPNASSVSGHAAAGRLSGGGNNSTAAATSGVSTFSSAGGPSRGASVATAIPSSAGGASRGVGGAPAGLSCTVNNNTAKPLSEAMNLALDGASVDLEQVYFDRRIVESSHYGGWFALRNGDAYRRLMDVFGVASWPSVLLLDPAGNVVSFQALEHVEKEIGHYYYARYMRQRPKPPPPLMFTAPSDASPQLASTGAPAAPVAVSPKAIVTSSVSSATGGAVALDHNGSLGGPTSPLHAEDDVTPSSATPPAHPLRRRSTGEHSRLDGAEEATEGGTTKHDVLSNTASPLDSGKRRTIDAEAPAATDGAQYPDSADAAQPLLRTGAASGSGPTAVSAPPALPFASVPAGPANDTQVFCSPLGADEPPVLPHSQSVSEHSHSAGSHHSGVDSASFTSGTLMPPSGAAAIAAVVAAGSSDAVRVPDLSAVVPAAATNTSEPAIHASAASASLPTEATHDAETVHVDPTATRPSADAQAAPSSRQPSSSPEGWPVLSVGTTSPQPLESSANTDVTAMLVTPRGVTDLAGAARPSSATAGGFTAPRSAVVGRAPPGTAPRSGPAIAFCSAFPWCPTRTGQLDLLGDDTAKDDGSQAGGSDDDNGSNAEATAEEHPQRPARPSLQPLLMRALALARPVGDITGDHAAASVATLAVAPAPSPSSLNAAHVLIVFGAHWHPAVAPVLKAVEALVRSVNGPPKTHRKVDMSLEELDGEGLFGGGLGGLNSGFSGGFGGGFSGGGGFVMSGVGEGGSLEELDGELPSTHTGANDNADDDAVATDTKTSPRVHVLYVCTDDTLEELRESVRTIPDSWSCLSPALGARRTHGSTDSVIAKEADASTSHSHLLTGTPPRMGSSATAPPPPRGTQYDGTCRATASHWWEMSPAEVVTWLMGCFNVTTLPRVVVLQRFPRPAPSIPLSGTDAADESAAAAGDDSAERAVPVPPRVTWRPVQWHAEATHLFQDPHGDTFPWAEPNALFSGVVGNDDDSACGAAEQDPQSGCDDVDSKACTSGGMSWSPDRRALMATRSSSRLFATHADSCWSLLDANLNRHMSWYRGAEAAASDDGSHEALGLALEEEEEEEEARVGLGQSRRRAPCECLSDWRRHVIPPIAPFTLEVTVPRQAADTGPRPATHADGDGDECGTDNELGMYPTEEPPLPSALLRPPQTPIDAAGETVRVPSTLAVRVRRGGYFVVLCAFGPVEASLHRDCVAALGEARVWLADVLSERKRKAWEAAQRSRDLLTLTLPLRAGQTVSTMDNTQSSPRGSAGGTWLPTLSTFGANPPTGTSATLVSGLTSSALSEENRMRTSPPPFTSLTSERSLNSTYVLNDVQRALQLQAPADYDGERGIVSYGSTLPLVYLYDAVYALPRPQAAVGAPALVTGGTRASSFAPRGGPHTQTPEIAHDHTRAAREAHADDLAFLQEHILATVLEADETQLPPREGEIFLACVRLPQKIAAVLRRRLPSETPATAATAPPSTSPASTGLTATPTTAAPTPTTSSASPPSSATAGLGSSIPDPTARPSSASASAGRAKSQANPTVGIASTPSPSAAATATTTSSAASANTRRASLSLEGTEMGVDGGHSGSPSLAATLRKELSPDPDVHPVALAATVKQFLYEQIIEGLQDA